MAVCDKIELLIEKIAKNSYPQIVVAAGRSPKFNVVLSHKMAHYLGRLGVKNVTSLEASSFNTEGEVKRLKDFLRPLVRKNEIQLIVVVRFWHLPRVYGLVLYHFGDTKNIKLKFVPVWIWSDWKGMLKEPIAWIGNFFRILFGRQMLP